MTRTLSFSISKISPKSEGTSQSLFELFGLFAPPETCVLPWSFCLDRSSSVALVVLHKNIGSYGWVDYRYVQARCLGRLHG